MTTDIEGGSAHVYCCADFNDGVNGNSCVGVNDCDCVDTGDIIGACLVDNMLTSGVSFPSSCHPLLFAWPKISYLPGKIKLHN